MQRCKLKREQFKRIIQIMQPQMVADKVKITKTYYRAYLYVVHFTFEEKHYELRMYTVDNHAEINEIHTRTVYNKFNEPVELTDANAVCTIQELSDEDQQVIEKIFGE